MIQWLFESAQNRNEPPEAFLSAAELETFAGFRFEKRSRDWLLGRWTAKRLMQRALEQQTGQRIELDALEIFNDGDGAPYATLATQPLAWSLSISHSNNHALCACSPQRVQDKAGMMVGADLEWIEPHEAYLVHDYFTVHEQARVNGSTPAVHDTLITAIWSAKEAVLKALHKGLSVDTRAVEISIPQFEQAPAQWTLFDITYQGGDPEWSPMHGWWCTKQGFVLTLATDSTDAPD